MALRNRRWIILALILGLIPASFLGLFGVTYLRARKVIDQFAVESDRRSEDWNRTGAVRPPVFGGPFEGNAWEIYQPVLSGWRQLPGTRLLLTSGSQFPDLKEADFLPSMHSSIDAMRRALGAAARAPGLDVQMAEASKTTCITLLYALQKLEQERPEACLELVTVLVGLKQDLRRNYGDVYSLDGSNLVLETWKDILENHRLRPAALRELALRLEALERTLPTAAHLLRAEVTSARHILHQRVLSGEKRGTPSWKVFWSSTIEAAATLKAVDEEYPKLEAKCRLPRAGRLAKVVDYELNSKIGPRAFELCEREDAWVREYATVRLAVALTRFEGDRGTFPARLEDLVPDYLESLPRNLPEDFDVRYEPGKLTIRASNQEQVWTFRR